MYDYIFSKDFKYHERTNLNIISNATDTDIIIDIGCGHEPDVSQSSIYNAIGIDLNFEHGEVMVKYPIISDAQRMPIRSGVINFVNCQAILEHLPFPELCMNDVDYIMREDASGFILIPINSKQIRQSLNRFVKEFPFSMYVVVRALIKSATLWKRTGMLHISQISLRDISKKFKIEKVGMKRHNHCYFSVGGLNRILKRNIKVSEYAEWYIWFSKK